MARGNRFSVLSVDEAGCWENDEPMLAGKYQNKNKKKKKKTRREKCFFWGSSFNDGTTQTALGPP
jgi:hypothetical protein